jgi:hypothetical protein
MLYLTAPTAGTASPQQRSSLQQQQHDHGPLLQQQLLMLTRLATAALPHMQAGRLQRCCAATLLQHALPKVMQPAVQQLHAAAAAALPSVRLASTAGAPAGCYCQQNALLLLLLLLPVVATACASQAAALATAAAADAVDHGIVP